METQATSGKLKSFVVQCKRVWHLLKKPSRQEFTTVLKVSALGILIIGAAGFIISDGIKLVSRLFA